MNVYDKIEPLYYEYIILATAASPPPKKENAEWYHRKVS